MNKRFMPVLLMCVLALAAVLFLFSPFFYITDVVVIGNERIPESEIVSRAGITGTDNLLLFNTGDARQEIMENLYVDDVVFIKTYPGQLKISVSERHLSGYVEYMQGKYLYIDEDGRVTEINSSFTEKLPIVGGLKFDRVQLGEILEVEDADAFKTVVTYARLIGRHGMADFVSHIDVSDGANTRIMYYQIEFNVGDDRDADEKIRTMKAIAENLPNAGVIKGIVDLKEIREQYVCKVLV